ncbi:MAG TPA: endolytic transglycosylase MltG [Tessaracoccus flavescens]|uniref:Endolytic murein transglycosylase n=1 Tax=Tessaracoccus flavescens TaxID=399497 RepID=A0A921EN66_9ACTN|nr:endolytic transglycosylase MltG [Tessaracoccus flavescens]
MSPAFIDNDGRLDWRKIGYHARSAFAVLLSLAVLVGGGWFIYGKANDAYIAWRTTDDYIGEGGDPVEVLIPRGAGITHMGDLLTEAGVVKSTKAFREAAQESGEAEKISYGRYKLVKEIPAERAVAMMLDPANRVLLEVTFPEGTTAGSQWQTLSAKTGVPFADIQAAATASFAELGLPEWQTGYLEGFLFPAKYQVAEPVDPKAVMRTQVSQFKRIAERISLEGRAAEIGRTPMEVLITASIIAREVSNPADQPMVAAVIYNRLKQDMPLQMDSSVHYALGKFGKVTTTAADREVDSPYNTYRNKGLPPAPISNPGQTALEAALAPSESDVLYFVTVDLDSGETKFAATYEEHEANVQQFQAWCQANTGRC